MPARALAFVNAVMWALVCVCLRVCLALPLCLAQLCLQCSPSAFSVWHHGGTVPLSADWRGPTVNDDIDSSKLQLCRGLREWTLSAGVMDLMDTGMAPESGC